MEGESRMTVGLVAGFQERMGGLLSGMMGMRESEGEEVGMSPRLDGETRGRGSMHDLEAQRRSREGVGGGGDV